MSTLKHGHDCMAVLAVRLSWLQKFVHTTMDSDQEQATGCFVGTVSFALLVLPEARALLLDHVAAPWSRSTPLVVGVLPETS
jgi:hypothetical protein